MAWRERFFSYRKIIPDFSGFLEAVQRSLPTHLRVNRLKAQPAEVLEDLAGEGVSLVSSHPQDDTLYFAPDLESPGNLLAYFLGHIHPQALTSCLAAKALGPVPETCVLDLCAAPGGKTAHMAQEMENQGLLVANDLHTGRHPALSHNLFRLGVLNTVVTAYQAQEFPRRERFHCVLADVPCSGEGRFRAVTPRADLRTGRDAARFPEVQKRILVRGFDLLEEDGVLLYATCTYNPEENEAVVNHLLNQRDAEVLDLDPGVPFMPGLTAWNGERYDARLERTARFYPHGVDSVGFYMARLGRRG